MADIRQTVEYERRAGLLPSELEHATPQTRPALKILHNKLRARPITREI